MNALVIVALICIGLVGVKWRFLVLPIALLGALVAVLWFGLVASFAWLLAYPVLLSALERRGRLRRDESATGHLTADDSMAVDPVVEALRRYPRNGGGLGGGSFGGGGGSFGGGGASGGW